MHDSNANNPSDGLYPWQDRPSEQGHSALHHEAWDSAHGRQVGAQLGALFSKFARQGDMMTDEDWDKFGKIYLDISTHDPSFKQTVSNEHPASGATAGSGAPSPADKAPHNASPGSAMPPEQISATPDPREATSETPQAIPTLKSPEQTSPVPGPPENSSRPTDFTPPATDRAPAASDQAGDRSDEIHFPPQRGEKMTGSKFFHDVLHADSQNPKEKGLTGAAREKAILEQVKAGNIPDFLRHAKEVKITDRNGNTATMKVMPDYLAIGTDNDFVRVPMTPLLAKTIAEKYGLALPTKKAVDDIYRSADVKLTGQGLVNSKQDMNYMDGDGFYLKHNQIIARQLNGKPQDALVAGHKKDIIISRFAQNNPQKLDFYGLFDKDGHAIQGAHGGPHENTYVDYSHGARFICQDMIVNGRHMTYDQVLKDPALSGLLSDEGTIQTEAIYKQPINRDYMEVV